MNNKKSSRKEEITGSRRCIAFVVTILIWLTVFNTVATDVYAETTTSTTTETTSVNLTITKAELDEIINNIGPEMDIAKTTGISKEDFIFAIQNCKYDYNGILKENAELIYDLCQKYDNDEFAASGFIAAECQWCTSPLADNKKNIMSVKDENGKYKKYDSYAESIEDGMRLLNEEYIDPDGEYHTGSILMDIGKTYDGTPAYEDWANLVANCAEMCTRSLKKELSK